MFNKLEKEKKSDMRMCSKRIEHDISCSGMVSAGSRARARSVENQRRKKRTNEGSKSESMTTATTSNEGSKSTHGNREREKEPTISSSVESKVGQRA